MKRVWSIMLALVLAVGLAPAVGVFAEDGPGPDVVVNYAFVPNAEEASVSKVDLMSDPPAEVARYSTVQPRSAHLYPFDKYRVSRLTMDSQGNAWALNSMTGRDYNISNAQGQVVRISAHPVTGEIPGVTTSDGAGYGAILDTDVRVTVFDVGNAGDCPRTISIVEEGGSLYVWIGFYMAEYFEKHQYDPVANTLTSTGDVIDVAPYNAYTAVIDGNGILWGVSRNASPYPSPSGTPGVFCFDTNDLTAPVTALPYDLPGKGGENPYAIRLKTDGTVWVSDGSNWGTNQARYFAVYTYGSPPTVQYVWTGVNSQAMRGFMEDTDGNIWATSINGLVVKLTWDGTAWVGSQMLSGLGELTGIGSDASGYYWVIRYGSDQMSRFDPTATPLSIDASVPLGDGPYAYGDFVQTAPQLYSICGVKYADWEGDEIALPDWEITLEKWDDVAGVWVEVDGSPQLTDGNGAYCFTELEAGDYRVSETLKEGWDQVSPVSGFHYVALPDTDDTQLSYDFHNTPHLYCFDETAWAADGAPATTRFVPAPGNWATYIGDVDEVNGIDGYSIGDGTAATPVVFPLYAGQTHYAGNLLVWDDGNTLYVKYVASGEDSDPSYNPNYCEGTWTGLTEYHLQVVDEFADFEAYRVYNKNTLKYGAPVPGRFDNIWEGEKRSETDPPIAVDISELWEEGNEDLFIAAHAVMWWCGYNCGALQEIADAQNDEYTP